MRTQADLDVDIGSTPRGPRARWTARVMGAAAVVGAAALWLVGWEIGAVLTALLIVPPCVVIALKR